MISVNVFNFLIVGLFLIIWNAVFLFVNVEARRNHWQWLAAVTGLHS